MQNSYQATQFRNIAWDNMVWVDISNGPYRRFLYLPVPNLVYIYAIHPMLKSDKSRNLHNLLVEQYGMGGQ